uniref:Secreted protein n=1 Tax=Peronospora matthiolae TaxID=2874970 RepID=A0AAV1UW08_9STRA
MDRLIGVAAAASAAAASAAAGIDPVSSYFRCEYGATDVSFRVATTSTVLCIAIAAAAADRLEVGEMDPSSCNGWTSNAAG